MTAATEHPATGMPDNPTGAWRLAKPVAVSDGAGRTWVGEPGDTPPEWAAVRLTSPIVWARPRPPWTNQVRAARPGPGVRTMHHNAPAGSVEIRGTEEETPCR